MVTLLTSQAPIFPLKLFLGSDQPLELKALDISVTPLTSQSGIAPYLLFVHRPSSGLVDKQSFIASWKLKSVIGVNSSEFWHPGANPTSSITHP